MANPDLPQDILLEIFSTTPTKFVGKCRTLSKSWNTNLSTPNFINKHFISHKQQQNLALTTRLHDEKVFIITSPTKNNQSSYQLQFIKPEFGWLSVVGSCNGLVLLNSLTLFNPITRKQVQIPFPQFTERKDLVFWDSVYGFGFDSCSHDYKIVRLCSYSSNVTFMFPITFVDVYSLKNRVWRRLADDCYRYHRRFVSKLAHEGGAFLRGALHWFVSGYGYRSCIAAFDLAKEVFREIDLPEGFVRRLNTDVPVFVSVRRSHGVSVVGGCLLIVDNHGDGTTDVWIQREYGVEESWVKFRIASENGDYKWDKILATLCYVKEGELLCLTSETCWNYMFACDLKGGTVRRVVLGERDAWFVNGIAFEDSLVCPEGFWEKDEGKWLPSHEVCEV